MTVNAKIASAYVDLVARTESFERALNEAKVEARKWSQEMREESHKSREAIAMLGEAIGVHIPRHLQKVINELPGVTTAMNMAFAATPILLAGRIIYETGEKLVEFVKKNEEAAKKNAEAWRQFGSDMTLTNDQARVANDRLEEQIAKLEHKPQNGLKTALDEAAVAADELGKKLDSDIKKFAELMKQQSVGFGGQLAGKAPTGDITKGFEGINERVTEAQLTGQAEIRAARDRGDKKGVEEAQKRMNEELKKLFEEGYQFARSVLGPAEIARKAQEDWASGDPARMYAHPLSERSGFNSQDMVARIAMAQGGLAYYGSQVDALALSQQGARDKGTLAGLQGMDAAGQERIKKLEADLAHWKSLGLTSAGSETGFWSSMMGGEKNPTVLREIQNRATAALVQWNKEQGASNTQAVDALNTEGGGQIAVERAFQIERTKAATEAARKQFESALQQIEADEKLRDATIKLAAQRGQITPHEAAMALTASHGMSQSAYSDAYGTAVGAGAQDLGPAAIRYQLNQQGQAVEDALRETGTSWKGMIDDVFDEMMAKSRDTASKMVQVGRQTVDGINTELARAVTGQQANFRGVFQGAAEGMAKTALEKVEGLGLQALGIRHDKADGYHVFVDNLPGGNALPGGDLLKASGKGLLGMLNDSDWFGSLFGGRVFGAGGIFGGGHALGGDVAAGVPIDVGEMGRERFVPSVPGRIIPNSQLGEGQTLNIDARGTDPALTRANVFRACQAAAAAGSADAQRRLAERSMRRPR
jgi:hypothetical protein